MSFCVSCGEGMDDGWKACPKCGAAKGGQNQDVVAPQIIQQPITMVAGEPKSSEYRQVNQEKKPVNPIAVGAGVACFILALPAAIIGLLEFMDSLEWNGLFSLWTINSIIYTVSTLMILIGSGLFLTGVLNDTMKMGLGATLIAVSFLGLVRRISSIHEYFGFEFEAISSGWVHEQLELSFLGMLIGIFIMNSVNRSRDVV